MSQKSVFIIGAGYVGAATAQALALKETVSDIVLIDINEQLAKGQAMDISHGTAYTDGITVRAGDYTEIKDDDIIIITSGVSQKPGQTRRDLLDTNIHIVRDVVGNIAAQQKNVFIVMVTNPVDVLTHVAIKASGLPKERVFGSGTTLDTARLRVLLAEKCNVPQSAVDAYVFGEHGESAFAALSQAAIDSIPLETFPGYPQLSVESINETIRNAVYEIIAAKKSTYYGISSVTQRIVEALLSDRDSVLPVCSLAQGEYGLDNVVVGLPSRISSRGVKIVEEYPFSDAELRSLHESAHIIAEHTQKVL